MSWIILTLLFLAGSGFLTVGLIGRRVGDTPYCRRCRYNLTGGVSGSCPECGAALTRRGMIRGLRVRRRGMVLCGAALMAVPLAAGALAVRAAVTGMNWYAYQPYTWVLSAAEDGELKAVEDLCRRYRSSTIPPHRVPDLVTLALDLHGRRNATHLPLWTNLLDDLATRGDLDLTQFQRYHDQMITVHLDVPPRIRTPGVDPIELLVSIRAPKPSGLKYEITIKNIRMDGEPLLDRRGEAGYRWKSRTTLKSPAQGCWTFPLNLISTEQQTSLLTPGKHTLATTVTRRLLPNWTGTPVLDDTTTLRAEFEVLDPDQPTGSPVNPCDAVREVLTVDQVQMMRWDHESLPLAGHLVISFGLREGLPCDLLVEVLVRSAGREYTGNWQTGRKSVLQIPRGQLLEPSVRVTVPRGFEAGPVEVVLRSAAPDDQKDAWVGVMVLGPMPIDNTMLWHALPVQRGVASEPPEP